MKIQKVLSLVVAGVLIVGGGGIGAQRAFAQAPVQAAVAIAAPTSGDGIANDEAATGQDTDNVDEQIEEVDAAQDDEALGAEDSDSVQEQVEEQDATDTDAETADTDESQDAVATGTPAITADQAQAAAEASLSNGSASAVELDDENGQLVYSVQIGTSDVKIDAMTGAVVGTETGED